MTMGLDEAIRVRHAVRHYTDRPIPPETADELQRTIDRCNREGDLNMQLRLNDPAAFEGFLTDYGIYRGARNLVAIVSDKTPDWEERCGYYGAHVLLRATQLGLDTGWVRQFGRHLRKHIALEQGERPRFAIVMGYGVNHGHQHKSKRYDQVARVPDGMATPAWFHAGIEAALLAPTSLNQQKFTFVLHPDGRTVEAKAGFGPCTRTDLGIAKYHFEIGAGGDTDFMWT
ncbi:nitroreductase family protein [Bifidobacterium sp. ESL0763]|uniref:nitroreductase family protein n=1 Tax=Bifidobacterium sp. ESL0763 TaxID=2983227 RepID=UPI0023F79512|nr:nitroreductase family protein [Bifidobacterium sp. ESL0763]MDF7663880.1 nitroreductase family protein [Bifidobacterium sp. ESL0763]